MKKLLFFLIFPLFCFGQNYNGPESIEHNPLSGSYFISNSNNGQILELDSDNNLSVFIDGLNTGPHGLELVEEYVGEKWAGQVLYACSGGSLYGYDMNGNEVLNYSLNGSFLNGITHISSPFTGENDLFITDFSAKKLYKYSIDENAHYEICSFNKNPNGAYYDQINNRLLVVFWGNNAPIYEIDLINETYTNLLNTGLGYLDGITMDQCGNFYISAWSSNAIHKYSSDFSETEILVSNMNNPADIYYNQFDNILAIPNSGNNTVDLIFVSCDNSFLEELYAKPYTIKNIDFLGRETGNRTFQLHLYDDGSFEKKYLINQK